MQKLSLFFLIGFLISGSIYAQTTSGGPDKYGYTWKSSMDPSKEVKFQWIDLAARVGKGAIDVTDKFGDLDKTYGPINFSFDFPFYWYTRNYLYINSGGMVCFNGGPYAEPYPAIPEKGGKVDDYIAAFWTNLSFLDIDGAKYTPLAKCYFYTDFKDSVIVSWHDVPFFNGLDAPVGSPPNLTKNTFQIILTRDGSILFQYLKLEGQQQSCQTGGVCISVGVENINGTSGLQAFKASSSATDVGDHIPELDENLPIAVKFFPPAEGKKYSNVDAGIHWTDNVANGGKFIAKAKPADKLKLQLSNNGFDPTPAFDLTTKIFEEGKTTPITGGTKGKKISQLGVAERRVESLDITVPTTKEVHYRVENSLVLTGDVVKDNDKLNFFIGVVDTTESTIVLDYNDGSFETGIKWNGADNDALGYANYFEPPFYPVVLKEVIADLSNYVGATPGAPIVIRIFADDGLNLFGQKDGSAGTKLYEKLIPITDMQEGENLFELDTAIQINSGGVYVGVFFTQNTTQGADTYLGFDKTAPYSYRTFFVRNGVFQESTDRLSQDAAIALGIGKGDIDKVFDLQMSEVVSPKENDQVTDSVEVAVKLKNTKKIDISGPIEVTYQADGRAEVTDTISAAVTIKPGEEYTYTFRKKCAAPPPPRTSYKSFCAKLFLANDYDRLNNSICYGEVTVVAETNIVNFRLYPNPAIDRLNVVYGMSDPSSLQFEIYDLAGKIVMEQNLGVSSIGMHQFDVLLDKLPNGIYNCRLVSNKGVVNEKLTVVR